ncbi:MAG: hypothetical protein M1819_003452 [Sarea resinae]|nr:MAG: hypothetical protein M1819_003452 [Sarea resinae]
MESLKTILIANRGEIAARISRTAKALGIRTIGIYSEVDAASQHVSQVDEAVLLSGPNGSAYTDGENIIQIAKAKNADAIIPGYGFLSENADFAQAVISAGLVWVGPSSSAIESFGLKHKARDLAKSAGVPIVLGTDGLVETEEDAMYAAGKIGYPVMLKATGGGGGMGLVTCHSDDEVKEGFAVVQSRGASLFKNPGVFVEKYYPACRHIEVQVFGNGRGEAIHFGERECSIQRRHQKVIEECPSPFVTEHTSLRAKLGEAAVRLAESVEYASAGTIEYLVDDETGNFFFLEMNTRLQVEHGITELCYDVDLVALMLEQADAQLSGKGGIDGNHLKSLQPSGPKGAAIEARVYAENPVRDFAPSPGLLQSVEWYHAHGTRIDTWVSTGTKVTPFYDPLIAKIMSHGDSRSDALRGMVSSLTWSRICGTPTNLEFLSSVIADPLFQSGRTLTSFLDSFHYTPFAIDVRNAGAYTLIQDLPGRPAVGKGIPHSGPMDPIAFQIANLLVGNPREVEGLEITLTGPELLFLGPAVVALCGAHMDATLDGKQFDMWTRHKIEPGQLLRIGKTIGTGCRSYLAVYGGFPSIADYFESKSTSPLVGIGGYQGRQLLPGDLLAITKEKLPLQSDVHLPVHLIPPYAHEWEIQAMVGPYDEGYLLPEDIEMIYNTPWKVSHNASRGGVRLIGPVPKWARTSGGEGGAHPSNLIEYGYPLGTLNWTGDDPCVFPVDSPNFGGFVSSTTIIRAEWWKLGQVKAGDTIRYRRVSFEDALASRKRVDLYLDQIEGFLEASPLTEKAEAILPLTVDAQASSTASGDWGKAVIWERGPLGHQPRGGDDHLIVDYGDESFDLNHRCRVTELDKLLKNGRGLGSLSSGLINTMGCCNSLMLFYDSRILTRAYLVSHLQTLEDRLGDLSAAQVPCRRFHLPITFESKAQAAAIQRYMETQRPHAPYLPDNLAFVAKNNAMTSDELKRIYLTGTFMAVCVGFFCGNTVSLPVDPRQRMSCPKQNPSRVFTPEGTVSWGGSCMSIYPVDSPGGYQMTGRTIPCFDQLGTKPDFSPAHPWLFHDFDLLTYYLVSQPEMEALLADFHAGRYRFEYDSVTFDMRAHNRLLVETSDEVAEIRKGQAVAQEEMVREEEESLRAWRREKETQKPDPSVVEHLLQDPDVQTLAAPLDANVWKVCVEQGARVESADVVVILEAMKLEIAVRLGGGDDAGDGGKEKGGVGVGAGEAEGVDKKGAVFVVEKVLISPGDVVRAGDRVILFRRVHATAEE